MNYFSGRSFLALETFSAKAIISLVRQGIDLKQKKLSRERNQLLAGKHIVLIFDKPSTRTRCAFEVAAYDEGAHCTYFSNSHIGHKESIEDTAKVLGRFYHGIAYRGYEDKVVEQLAHHAGIPVWNALTDRHHPTQVLADLMTIQEKINKPFHQIKFVYAGDAANNVCHSLMVAASKLGMRFLVFSPPSLRMSTAALQQAGLDTEVITFIDHADLIDGADVIYTDVWVSMGEEESLKDKVHEKIQSLLPYQVTMDLLKKTRNPDVIFMHCLPAFHDDQTDYKKPLEVTDEVFRSTHSVVFDQAENRLHTIKALMIATLL